MSFYNCPNLRSVAFPESLHSIGHQAFASCKQLSHALLPDNLHTVGKQAFENCSNLTNVVISSLNCNVESDAFTLCTNLSSITLPSHVESEEQEVQSAITQNGRPSIRYRMISHATKFTGFSREITNSRKSNISGIDFEKIKVNFGISSFPPIEKCEIQQSDDLKAWTPFGSIPPDGIISTDKSFIRVNAIR
jgi:hypothetical protein